MRYFISCVIYCTAKRLVENKQKKNSGNLIVKGLFYQPVKVDAKNHQILFWGCLHYGHDPKWDIPIWKRRGFNSSAEHDEAIINNWNSGNSAWKIT